MAIVFILALAGITLIFLEFSFRSTILAAIGTIALLVSLGLLFSRAPAFWGIVYLLVLLLAVYLTCRLALWRQKTDSLQKRYAHLVKEISDTTARSGRDPTLMTLVAVTKSATLEQMQEAYVLGIRHFGENRLQTALPKIQHFPSDVKWHFIGALQSNKIGKIVEHFDYIHSVDSLKSAELIAEKSAQLHKKPKLFLEINTSKESTKQGFSEEELLENFEKIAALNLDLIGLMTIAPLSSDPQVVRSSFKQLKSVQKKLPMLTHLSMGMSSDFRIAIEEGATFVRIGSALFEKSK